MRSNSETPVWGTGDSRCDSCHPDQFSAGNPPYLSEMSAQKFLRILENTLEDDSFDHDQHYAQRKEVLLNIEWWDGQVDRERFAQVEDAILHFRQSKRTAARRRSKTDRREIKRAYYVGCTSTGKTYGGWLLTHSPRFDTDSELASQMANWKHELDRSLRGENG